MATNRVGLGRMRAGWLGSFVAAAVVLGATAASAETLLMPNRDFLMGTPEVVWGVTTQANGTAFTIDYGDGSPDTVGNVADRSYIAFNHTYAISGTFTITLTVGAEVATTEVKVYNGGSLSTFDLRGVNTNRAIQDGLRYLWTAQTSRAANFPAGVTTNWGGFGAPDAALIVLAFENHGYNLPNSGAAATGLYEKYVVERGLNYVGSQLSTLSLTVQTAGSPCVGAGIEAAPCTGFYYSFDPGYSTAVVALPFAGSGALNRTFGASLGVVSGKTYREVLQRIMNSVAYGQGESGAGRGGWDYGFNSGRTDGSTVGWDVLALLDAGAAGITIPGFVKTEFDNFSFNFTFNTNGSFDYTADSNAASLNNVNFQKGGIGLQGLYYTGQVGTGDAQVNAAVTYLSDRWSGAAIGGDVGFWACGSPSSNNKGCAYGMFNAFKGLKLHGVQTLPGVGRAAGPGPIPANDWYADYVDWLLANQTLPTTTGGGYWQNLGFSCCHGGEPIEAAMAELILAPVALIQPDPTKFSTVGLTPFTATNPVGTAHTVTAKAESDTGTPVPGATVNFVVLTGPNAGQSGQDVTDQNGQATFTYTDANGPGTDTIQASIGTLNSNIVEKHWVLELNRCDVDDDGDIDKTDIGLIRAANRQNASGPNDPRDGNGDGKINVADQRYCTLRCTNAQCAPGAPSAASQR
jgi:hypothetical protein